MEESRKPTSALKRLRHRLEYAIVAFFAWATQLMSYDLMRGVARAIGYGAFLCRKHDREVAYANLELVLGDSIGRAAKRRIVRRTFQRMTCVLMGMLWAPRLTRERANELLDGTELWDVFRGFEARRRGVVAVTAHYGDWELFCYASALNGLPLLMVTEAMPNPLLEPLVNRVRGASGNRTIPPRFALLKLFRGLRQGERVAVMTDVNGRRGRGGVWLEFFGLPVFNGTALAELALRTNSAVVFAAVRPTADGRYRVVCPPPIEFQPTGDHGADVRALSQQTLNCLADLIRADPEPWLWTYKRWKRRPMAEVGNFPFYSKFARTE